MVQWLRNRVWTGVVVLAFNMAFLLGPAMLLGQSDPAPNYVVNTTADDATETAANCTSSPERVCTLRDALAAASAAGSGNITFDPTVFLSTNTAAENTIKLANGTLNIPSNTTVARLTTLSGATLTYLVTVLCYTKDLFNPAFPLTMTLLAATLMVLARRRRVGI